MFAKHKEFDTPFYIPCCDMSPWLSPLTIVGSM